MSNKPLTLLELVINDASGSPFVNQRVLVTESESGNLTRLYTSDSKLLSTSGATLTSSEGRISVYVRSGLEYDLTVLSQDNRVMSTVMTVEPSASQSVGATATTQALVSKDSNGLVKLGTPNGTQIYASQTLLQTAVPFVLPPSGTMGNNGLISWGSVAVPVAYASAYVYLPANAIQAGSSAGWYYAVFSSTQACTVYNNPYITGQPQVPQTPIPFVSTGPGAFTSVISTDTQSVNVQIPGLVMGVNGCLRVHGLVFNVNSGTNKVNRLRVGTDTIRGAGQTTTQGTPWISHFMNAGTHTRQRTMNANHGDTGAGNAMNDLFVNTALPGLTNAYHASMIRVFTNRCTMSDTILAVAPKRIKSGKDAASEE